MTAPFPRIAGIGSVTPYGPLAGLIPTRTIQPQKITAWPAASESLAYLVEPFNPAAVVPGLKTRRLDRLSVWSLVAASLALKDSAIDLTQVDRSRIAVVFATGLGCLELTEAFLQSAQVHGWSQTDPILFPETLGNAPTSHVARCLDLRGPNITVSSKGVAAECALLQAASLLRHGQADLSVVLAGDTLTRGSYEWYEAAGMLRAGFIPGEGVTAMVLARADSPKAYAQLRGGHFATRSNPAEVIRKATGGVSVRWIAADSQAAHTAGVTAMLPSDAVATGMGDAGALLRLAVALPHLSAGDSLLLLGASSNSAFAALLLELT